MWFFGVGMTTGFGWGVEATWCGLRQGDSACRPDAELAKHLGGEPVFVARVPDGGDAEDGPSVHARAVRATAREAVQDARARGWRPGPVVGLVHGGVLDDAAAWRAIHRDGAASRRQFCAAMPSTPLYGVMAEFGWHGPVMSVAATCATSAAALLTAASWLRDGIVDDVVVVVADFSITPEILRGFHDLGVAVFDAPARQACRPFQEGSRGFLLAEAAAAFVVSGRPGAGAYGRLRGGAMTHDAHHVIALDPSRDQLRLAVERALTNAGTAAAEVGYVNAHGPGTRECDAAEADVVDDLFGGQTSLYSLKPLLGHCQSAAGGVETAVTLLGYDRSELPAPTPVATAHPRLLPGPVPYERVPTLKTSLGMGGYNVAVVLDAP
jgi:3-oxoacyl-[acyl-carrier-protein] synthase II